MLLLPDVLMFSPTVSLCLIRVNSGLYAMHYARAFDDENLHYDVKEPTDVSYFICSSLFFCTV